MLEKPTAEFKACYAVTISPSDKVIALLGRGSINHVSNTLLELMAPYLFPIRKMIEISGVFELGKKKRLHTHFKLTFLKLQAQITFDRSIRYRIGTLGMVYVDTSVNKGWDTYMGKECIYMASLGVEPYRTEDFNESWRVQNDQIVLKRKTKKKVKYPKSEPPEVHAYKITDYAIEWKQTESSDDS